MDKARVCAQRLTRLLRHFDEIAEKIIVLDAEIFNACRLSILRLQAGDNFAAVITQAARRIEFRIIASANKLPITPIERQLIRKSIGKACCKSGIKRCECVLRITQELRQGCFRDKPCANSGRC